MKKIIISIALCLTQQIVFAASIQIKTTDIVKECQLILFQDYFTNTYSTVKPSIHIKGLIKYNVNPVSETFALVNIDGQELQLVIAKNDEIILEKDHSGAYQISEKSTCIALNIQKKQNELLEFRTGFGKKLSKKEFKILDDAMKNYLNKSDYESTFLGFYSLELIYSFKNYHKHISLDEIAALLDSKWYAHNVPTYIGAFKWFTQKYPWKLFHNREIGNFLYGDSTDIKYIIEKEPFARKELNMTYQMFSIEYAQSFGFIWRKNYAMQKLNAIKSYFKTEGHLYAFASAYNLYKNNYGQERKPAYDLTLYDIDSNQLKLSDLNSQFVLIDFWATWCGPCIASMPKLAEYQKEHPNLKIIMLSRDRTFAQFKNFVNSHDYNLDFYFIGNSKLISAAYKIQSLPHKVIVGKDGNIYLSNLKDLTELEAYKSFWEN